MVYFHEIWFFFFYYVLCSWRLETWTLDRVAGCTTPAAGIAAGGRWPSPPMTGSSWLPPPSTLIVRRAGDWWWQWWRLTAGGWQPLPPLLWQVSIINFILFYIIIISICIRNDITYIIVLIIIAPFCNYIFPFYHCGTSTF